MVLTASSAEAEWTHRYPTVEGVNHHIYLEGFDLPTFSATPMDPAPSPDAKEIAFARQGWLWVLEVEKRVARRVTRGGGVDSRPSWSPDGSQIAFVRDTGQDTAIMSLDLATGVETVLVDSSAIDLDPAYSGDGRWLYYSSAKAGSLDIWRLDLSSGVSQQLTNARGQELNPRPLANGQTVAYKAEPDVYSGTIELLSLVDGRSRVLRKVGLSPQTRISSLPSAQEIVATIHSEDGLRLERLSIDGASTIISTPGFSYPIAPALSGDNFLWFASSKKNALSTLVRVSLAGQHVEEIAPMRWEWGEPIYRLRVNTKVRGSLAPTRISVVNQEGHPFVAVGGPPHFDGQNGRAFFYTPGTVEMELVAGTYNISVSHGFVGAVDAEVTVGAGRSMEVDLDVPSLGFDGAAKGWYSADLHSHLNYGGTFQLEPDDLVLPMLAEDLAVATPMVADLESRKMDERWWGWRRDEPPIVRISQEVRSHFLGHIGVIGAEDLFEPWSYGPHSTERQSRNLTNADALQFSRFHGGLNAYVHPVGTRQPFPAQGDPTGIPLALVSDAVLGDVDALEIACLWSDELGTSEVWYRLLNLGLDIVPTAGSDTMQNFYRTMAIGSARTFAKVDGALTWSNFFKSVRGGRSFVSTGPLIEFDAAGISPGETLKEHDGTIDFRIDLWSIVPIEHVEIVGNGKVLWSGSADHAGRSRFSGRIAAPTTGWLAVRAYGDKSYWPLSDSYPFAHTAPVWLSRRGSVDPLAARASAVDLLRWLDVADKRINLGYGKDIPPQLTKRVLKARRTLVEIARSND